MLGSHRPGAARAILSAVLSILIYSGSPEHFASPGTLLRRADRDTFPHELRVALQHPYSDAQSASGMRRLQATDPPQRNASADEFAGNETADSKLSFAAALAPYSEVAAPPSSALSAAKLNASATECDIFARASTIQCASPQYSDLPSFACCDGSKDDSVCVTGTLNTVCPSSRLPACCFARNQVPAACTARNENSECGREFPVEGCCSDSICTVGRYGRPLSCDSDHPNAACCPP